MTRTLEMWRLFIERTGNKNVVDYLLVGDVVTEDLINYIRNHMPLETDKIDYLQLKEISFYTHDISRALRPVYPTFAACNTQWRYYGDCHKWESINRF